MELDPHTTAVVVVHCQGDVVGPNGAFAELFRAQVVERNVLAHIANLTEAGRRAGVTVVYTRVAWKPDFSDLHVNSPLLGIISQSGCLKDGSPLAEIVEEVAPHEQDVVITHQRIGGFEGSALDAVLRERGIDVLLFTGVATNASVEGTARAASDLGYRVMIVDDACAAASPEIHAASLGSLRLFAEIVTINEVLPALSTAGIAAGVS